MRILLADSLPDACVDALRRAGDTVTVEPGLTTPDLPGAVADHEVLVVRSTRVDAATIDAGHQLGLIVRAGAGTNTIDCEHAAHRGVHVCNVPGRNALAVAELTLGLILAVDRHIADATADLRAGRWNKKAYADAAGLAGRRLGIIGLGEIGLAVARRARGFEMQVRAQAKPGRDPARVARAVEAGVELVDTLEEVLDADVVSLHVPATRATTGLVDDAFLAAMRDGAILVNTSRGEIVDEPALLRALDERGMRAGLDVFADEPGSGVGTIDSALARHPRVVGTHHIGASTRQAQEAVAAGTIEVIEAYRSGQVVNCVNLAAAPPRTGTLVVRHLDRVGVLAAVFDLLRRHDVNVETMSNRVFEGAVAAVASIDVNGPAAELLPELASLPDVIGVTFTPT